MSGPDEPVLEPSEARGAPELGPELARRLRTLVAGEPYGVLCTQGEGQPYGSLVAVAFTADLRHALFATPVTTRKYRLLRGTNRVAMVVDDRSQCLEDMMAIQAVTLTGRAVEIEREVERDEDRRLGGEFERWAGVLVERHPHLESFVHAESCALFRIDVLRYFHVERFQEVREWAPPSS